jgi:rhamnose utilization protein RhaD (predicted bifunctional aldolase and dehydrogenase)
MANDRMLEELTALAREFGGSEHVKGGGGNVSCKDARTLYVKPSGVTLRDLTPAALVALDRGRLRAVHEGAAPSEAQAREAWARELLAAAMRPETPGRPSVETPLHDSFAATFVVHTHPPLVNGLTCAREGSAACEELFPEALWVPYTDPGTLLSREVRAAMSAWTAKRGAQPRTVLLQNHGLFLAADRPEEVRGLWRSLEKQLREIYRRRGANLELARGVAPPEARARELGRAWLEAVRSLPADRRPPDLAEQFVRAAAPFRAAEGPLSPDHIVISGSFYWREEPSAAGLAAFVERHGRLPRVLIRPDATAAWGGSESAARLALAAAEDGALAAQLAGAFGGARYLDDRARRFIENWEVEVYRSRVMGVSGGR